MVAVLLISFALLIFNLVSLVIANYRKKCGKLTGIQIIAVFPLVYLISFSWHICVKVSF